MLLLYVQKSCVLDGTDTSSQKPMSQCPSAHPDYKVQLRNSPISAAVPALLHWSTSSQF